MREKNWPLEPVKVWLRHSKTYAADWSECETREGMLDRIERDVQFDGSLNTEQRSRPLEIANKCPVHRTLIPEIDIRMRLQWLSKNSCKGPRTITSCNGDGPHVRR